MHPTMFASYFAITVITMIVGAIITAVVDATRAGVGNPTQRRPVPQH